MMVFRANLQMKGENRATGQSCAPDDPALLGADEARTPTGIWARIRHVAATSGCPRRTSAAFALGVFLSFSPFLGLQLLMGLAIATALKLSRVAMFIGLWANLPWLMLPWYTLTTVMGAFLLRIPISPAVATELRSVMEHPFYRSIFWERLAEIAGPFLWAFVVGSTVGAMVVGAVAYFSLTRILERRLARQAEQGAADRHVHAPQGRRFESQEP